ncbi:hypothetical protein [Pectinatus brassicae]|uniref:Flagellar motor component MotA n=1 Tax=Pectinatus brassicae TaxID=862415 RepID=A0A840UG36_9FIRM|nr:hypothetical protein [Pectinatus brassicae]MBB5335969.1 flagellar motor component MotA [Pectinatus brassicae]
MEKSTLIGLCAGFISLGIGYVMKGADPSILLTPAAYLIIIGGTISCLFTGFTMEQMSVFPKLIKWEPHTRDFSRELGDQTSQYV